MVRVRKPAKLLTLRGLSDLLLMKRASLFTCAVFVEVGPDGSDWAVSVMRAIGVFEGEYSDGWRGGVSSLIFEEFSRLDGDDDFTVVHSES